MPIINATTGEPAGKDMRSKAQRYKELVTRRLPEYAEQRAQDVVDKSFHAEKYQDKNTSKWAGRKKEEQPGKERGKRRALLVGKTGRLVSSTVAERRGMDIVIGSDTPYSQIHNEGGRMGNGGTMPQRQYMPIPGEKNKELEEQIDKFVESELDKIFG